MESLQIVVNTYVFALALTVLGVVVALWRIWMLTRDVKAQDFSLRAKRKHFEQVWSRLDKLEKSTPTAIAARVDELSEAVAKLADTHRKFAGRMDRRYQLEGPRDQVDPNEVDDPTWNALRLAQQRQLGTPPNGSNL